MFYEFLFQNICNRKTHKICNKNRQIHKIYWIKKIQGCTYEIKKSILKEI